MAKGRMNLKIKGKAKEWGTIAAHYTFLWLGGIVFVSFLIALTPLPAKLYKWMGTSKAGNIENPEYIVLLGSGGVPSGETLMRMWYTREAAAQFPEARVIISTPGDTSNKESTISRTLQTLEKWGIKSSRLYVENKGVNTRQEALEIRTKLKSFYSRKKVILVTSPEHMRRAVLSFQKVGFQEIGGIPAFERLIGSSLKINQRKLGGNKLSVLKVAETETVRYDLWMQLDYELKIGREVCALTYYELKGWI